MKPEINDCGVITNYTEKQITKEICVINFGKKYSLRVFLKNQGFGAAVGIKNKEYDSELSFLSDSNIENYLTKYFEETNDKKPLNDYLKYIKTLKQESLF